MASGSNQDARPFVDLRKDAEDFKEKFAKDIERISEFLDERLTMLICDPDSLSPTKKSAIKSSPAEEFSRAKYDIFKNVSNLVNGLEHEWFRYLSELKKYFIENVEILLAGTKLEVKLPDNVESARKSPLKQRSSIGSHLYPMINNLTQNFAAFGSPLLAKNISSATAVEPTASDQDKAGRAYVKLTRNDDYVTETQPNRSFRKASASPKKRYKESSSSSSEDSDSQLVSPQHMGRNIRNSSVLNNSSIDRRNQSKSRPTRTSPVKNYVDRDFSTSESEEDAQTKSKTNRQTKAVSKRSDSNESYELSEKSDDSDDGVVSQSKSPARPTRKSRMKNYSEDAFTTSEAGKKTKSVTKKQIKVVAKKNELNKAKQQQNKESDNTGDKRNQSKSPSRPTRTSPVKKYYIEDASDTTESEEEAVQTKSKSKKQTEAKKSQLNKSKQQREESDSAGDKRNHSKSPSRPTRTSPVKKYFIENVSATTESEEEAAQTKSKTKKQTKAEAKKSELNKSKQQSEESDNAATQIKSKTKKQTKAEAKKSEVNKSKQQSEENDSAVDRRNQSKSPSRPTRTSPVKRHNVEIEEVSMSDSEDDTQTKSVPRKQTKTVAKKSEANKAKQQSGKNDIAAITSTPGRKRGNATAEATPTPATPARRRGKDPVENSSDNKEPGIPAAVKRTSTPIAETKSSSPDRAESQTRSTRSVKSAVKATKPKKGTVTSKESGAETNTDQVTKPRKGTVTSEESGAETNTDTGSSSSRSSRHKGATPAKTVKPADKPKRGAFSSEESDIDASVSKPSSSASRSTRQRGATPAKKEKTVKSPPLSERVKGHTKTSVANIFDNILMPAEKLFNADTPVKGNLTTSVTSVEKGSSSKSPKKVTFTPSQEAADDLDVFTPSVKGKSSARRKTLLPNMNEAISAAVATPEVSQSRSKRKTIGGFSDLEAEVPPKRLKASAKDRSASASQAEEAADNLLESDGNYSEWIPLKNIDTKVPAKPGVYEVKVWRAKKPAHIGHCESLRQKLTLHKLLHNSGHKHLDKFLERNKDDIQIRFEVMPSQDLAKSEVKRRVKSFTELYNTTPAYN